MAKINPKLAEGINRTMVESVMENYERYYRFAYSMVKNEEQTKRILEKTIYFSLYNGRKLQTIPRLAPWFFQLIVRDGMRKMHEYDKYKREFTYDSQLYAYMETIEPSGVNAFKLYYFEGFSINEICDILHLKEKEVEKRLKFVRHELNIDSSLEDESGERMEELLSVYNAPKIPDDLEQLVLNTIEKEKANFAQYMEKQKKARLWKPLLLIGCVALWFFGTIALARTNEDFGGMVLAVPILRHIFTPFIG